ncbi:MAG: hypothetical protein EOO48_13490 [Flavobacterium sp.]|nr:MAG: hypothetical protein EOO48_13490 [Flavobacterium sp.]
MQKITDGAVAASEQLEKTSIGQVDKCDMFAGNDEFGRAGEAFLKEIQKEEQIVSRNSEYGGEKKTRKVFEKLWEGPEDLRKLCVNYGTEKMTTDDKNALWVVIAAGISFIESTCDASESLKQTNGRNYGAPNGTAHGLVQLHLNDEAKYTSSSAILQLLPDLSADQVAARRCRNGDSKNPERTMTCAAKMLNLQLLRSSVNDDRGQLFSSNWSYWSSLKARGREGSHNGYKKTKGLPPAQYIMKNICENKACGNDIPKCMQIAKQITNAPTRLATTSAKKVRVASSRSAK